MKASMTRVLLTFAAWSVGAATVAGAQDAQRKRIAVLDFEHQTVRQYVHQIFGSDVDIGKGITTMLVTDLVRNGTYSVIERQALDQVLREQNFQASGRADASTAAELGKILGVDAVIIGSITQFGRDDQSVGAAGRVGVGPVRIGGFGRKKSKAVVGIDARIIDVQTAEILAVATGKGESSRSGTKLFGAGIGGIGAAGAIDMSSSNFGSTIIGEATREATEGLLEEVVAADARIVQKVISIEGLVADVVGNEVTINVGSGEGVRAGATYDVVRPGREITDPSTGKVLRRVTRPVGSLTIIEAGDGYAVGELSGGPAQVGD